MKNIITSIILVTIMTSCKSQNNIDLLELKLPLDKAILFNKKYTINEDTPKPDAKYYGAGSKDSKLMCLAGKNVYDEKKTELILYLSAPTDSVLGYRFINKTTKETKDTEAILDKKYGTPNYYTSDAISVIKVWEDKLNGMLYLFGHYYPSDDKYPHGSDLYAFNLENTEVAWDLGSSRIQYYLNYLNRRKKIQNPNYTFRDFAKEFAKDGDDKYLRKIDSLYVH